MAIDQPPQTDCCGNQENALAPVQKDFYGVGVIGFAGINRETWHGVQLYVPRGRVRLGN
jgi:hypothetical protein